jgi:hypothetical protein
LAAALNVIASRQAPAAVIAQIRMAPFLGAWRSRTIRSAKPAHPRMHNRLAVGKVPIPLAGRFAPYHHAAIALRRMTGSCATGQEAVMAKGQMRVPKEKKKPKADKDKPKQLSAYKLAQSQGSSGGSPYGNAPGKKS